MRRNLRQLITLVPLVAWACSTASEPSEHPPDVSITGPYAWATVLRGDVVDIEVAASDADGNVVSVSVYLDGRKIGQDSTPPYEFQWDTRGEIIGTHSLRAVAADDSGLESQDNIGLHLRWAGLAPEQLDDGWETANAADEGIHVGRVAGLMEDLYGDDYQFLHAVLVIRNGKLVIEEYFGDFTRNTLQHVQSTTKSVTSALIGIAIDRGDVGSVDDSLFRYLPEYADLCSADNEQITIKHCLMMAAGLQWNESSVPTLASANDNMIGNFSADYVAYFLSKRAVAEPGTEFYYNSGCPMTLGAILKNASGMPADSFAGRYLFGPLGIADFDWPSINMGKHVGTHGALFLRARDMAKFGQLFLQQGVWDGEQVVSAEWVAESTKPQLTVAGDTRYGYLWWYQQMNGYEVPFTSGYGGQHIFVVPELAAVIVTGTDYSNSELVGEQHNRLMNMVRNQLLPAIASPE